MLKIINYLQINKSFKCTNHGKPSYNKLNKENTVKGREIC